MCEQTSFFFVVSFFALRALSLESPSKAEEPSLTVDERRPPKRSPKTVLRETGDLF